MGIDKIPAFLVAVLTLYALYKGGDSKNSEESKRDLFIIIIKAAFVSLLVVILMLSIVYYRNIDFQIYYSYNEFLKKYFLIASSFVFMSVFCVQVFLPYLARDSFYLEKHSDGYSIKSSLWYDPNFFIQLVYCVKKSNNFIKLNFLNLLFKVLGFSLIIVLFLGVFQIFQYGINNNNNNVEYIANEKIFITNTEKIIRMVLKDDIIQNEDIPDGTLFSVNEGSKFSIKANDIKEQNFNFGNKVDNGIVGIVPGDEIDLEANSKIYFEEIFDNTVFLSDNNVKISKYYKVKTVPGETYFRINSNMKFKIVANSSDNFRGYYKFSEANSTDENLEKNFLVNLMYVSSMMMFISFFILAISLSQYLYLFLSSLLFVFSVAYVWDAISKLKEINFLWVVLYVAILVISLYEMKSYGNFLKQNILLKRREFDPKFISVTITQYGTTDLFQDSKQDSIDIPINERDNVYIQRIDCISDKKIKEIRIIIYSKFRTLLCEYFKQHKMLILLKNSRKQEN